MQGEGTDQPCIDRWLQGYELDQRIRGRRERFRLKLIPKTKPSPHDADKPGSCQEMESRTQEYTHPMAAATQVPLAEYLQTSYRPDRDYLDGELLERNMGETPHSALQAFLCWYFRNHQPEWQMRAFPEQRVQISATRYRIPDICLVSLDASDELIITSPPILCIEILSREDRMTDMIKRVDDYQRMGVPAVWAIDPWIQKAFFAAPDASLLQEAANLVVPGTPITLAVADVFAELAQIYRTVTAE